MILNVLRRLTNSDARYWHNGYFVRVYEDAAGWGWQIFRDNKFIYRDGQFIALIDGGHCPTEFGAHESAQDYINNILRRHEP
ncbi:hypothetical protein [Microcoleus sp. Pol17_C1]|uniref:hypothetical protein n=1 Tax=unclassified Microcoleus TaxID=2642155 RepID=UPI002FD043CC